MTLLIESGEPLVDLCRCERHVGDPRTCDTFVYVCDLPAGHEGYHEGPLQGQPRAPRSGWPDRLTTVRRGQSEAA